MTQFSDPRVKPGIILSSLMNISNPKLYMANLQRIEGRHCVLEIGFREGKQLEMIKKYRPDCQLYGIDVSEDMLNSAKKRLGGDVELTVEDIIATHFNDEFFDAVIATDACYYWSRPRQALTEIHRILKAGGFFVNSCNTMYASFVQKHQKGDEIYNNLDIISLAEEVGFSDLGIICPGKNLSQIIFEKNVF